MDNLFNIFQREKERVGDKFTVSYNEARKLLRYTNDEGTLTVVFDDKNQSEDFYFLPEAFKEAQIYGTRVLQITGGGHKGEVPINNIFSVCSQDFVNLCGDYQYNRDAIGVEKIARTMSKYQKTHNKTYERD